MFKIGDKVTVKEESMGYCHPNMSSDYTRRDCFYGEPRGGVIKVPETDGGVASFFVIFPEFTDPNNIWAFKSTDLHLIDEFGELWNA